MFGRKKVAKKRTVLFVDDDELVLVSLVRGHLQDTPYNILAAKSCKEAIEILQQKEVHIIVTDMCMPEMTGLELLRTVRKEYPDIIGIVLTGYTQDTELQTAVQDGEIFEIVPKPWKLGGDFEKLIQRAVEYYNHQSEREAVRQHN